jgi:hypothetical protein
MELSCCFSVDVGESVDCPWLSGTMELLWVFTLFALAVEAVALSIGGNQMHVERDSNGLQNIVRSPYLQCLEKHV